MEIRHRKGVSIPHVDGLTRERPAESASYRDDTQIETLYSNLQKESRKKEGLIMSVDYDECVIFRPNDRQIDVLPVCRATVRNKKILTGATLKPSGKIISGEDEERKHDATGSKLKNFLQQQLKASQMIGK